MIESFLMELNYDGIYCSWSFCKSKLIIDKASMPLIVSTFCHFAFCKIESIHFFYVNLHFCDMKIITNFLFTEAKQTSWQKISKVEKFHLPHRIKLDLNSYVMIQTPHKSVGCLNNWAVGLYVIVCAGR